MSEALKSFRNKLTVCSILVGILSVIIYILLCNATEYYFFSAVVIAFMIVTVMIQAVSVFLPKIREKNLAGDILAILLPLLYMTGLILFIKSSVEWIQHILSKDNVPGFSSLYIVCVAAVVAAAVVQIVSNFVNND